MASLEGKVVVVTGALGALGTAVAASVERAGATVARFDQPRADAAADPLFHGVDLTDEAATRQAMSAIAASCGRIDGLVNIAGGFAWQTLAEGSLGVWEQMFRINLMTAVTASRVALEHLGKNGPGSIVNIGANAASHAAAGMGAYAASKSGIARLTESLAEETAAAGVRVNAVLPGTIDTPANRRETPGADFKAWVAPEDIAKAIVFLLSDEAAAITGATIPVTNPRHVA